MSIGSLKSHSHSIGETKITRILQSDVANSKSGESQSPSHDSNVSGRLSMDSSNYNPIVALVMGCQMVALNFQTFSMATILVEIDY